MWRAGMSRGGWRMTNNENTGHTYFQWCWKLNRHIFAKSLVISDWNCWILFWAFLDLPTSKTLRNETKYSYEIIWFGVLTTTTVPPSNGILMRVSCEQYRTKIVENAISTESQALDVSVLEAAHTQQRNPGWWFGLGGLSLLYVYMVCQFKWMLFQSK